MPFHLYIVPEIMRKPLVTLQWSDKVSLLNTFGLVSLVKQCE